MTRITVEDLARFRLTVAEVEKCCARFTPLPGRCAYFGLCSYHKGIVDGVLSAEEFAETANRGTVENEVCPECGSGCDACWRAGLSYAASSFTGE